MITALQPLEKKLEAVFVKSAPALPADAKKVIVQYLPWINLIVGAATLWAAYALYNLFHAANRFIDAANSISAAYGGAKVDAGGITPIVYLGVAVLVIEAVIFIMAFPATRDHKKSGWDLMFYGALVNVAYGIVSIGIDGRGIGSLFGTIIGAAIGLYFLFQIRALYLKEPVKVAAAVKPHKKA